MHKTTRSQKTAISLRIDHDIVEWFRQQGGVGYQTHIHNVLRAHVYEENARRVRAAGRAQEIFRRWHARCFWHYSPDLLITEKNIAIVIDGLKLHGGKEGLRLAEDLCR